MVYFLPLSLQKRLLRYALSRLDLLETDALDLDRLGIEWGRKSTFELTNVALRKDKLTTVLRLPSHLRLDFATITRLKLTVPADIHSSPIAIEIYGVDVRVSVMKEQKTRSSPETSCSRQPPRPMGGAGSPDSGFMPSPNDLAKSFLAEEPLTERARLETAMNSSSVDLSQSVSSMSTAEDEVIGTGIGLALPTFLTSFLQGVSDRLQVVIRNVVIDVDLRLSAEHESNASEPGERTKPTTLRFRIDQIDVDGVKAIDTSDTVASTQSVTPGTTAGAQRRRISLKRISGCLLSAAEEPPDKAVPHNAAHHPSVGEAELSYPGGRPPSAQSPRQHGSTREPSPSDLGSSTTDMLGLDASMTLSTAGIFAYAHEEDIFHSGRSTPGDQTSSSPLSEKLQSYNLHDSLRICRRERPKSPSNFTFAKARHGERSPGPLLAQRRSVSPSFQATTIFPPRPSTLQGDEGELTFNASAAVPGNAPIETSTIEDMLESKVFSHEEAESIYMSVTGDQSTTGSTYFPMPGGWHDVDTTHGTMYRSSTSNQNIATSPNDRERLSNGDVDMRCPSSEISSNPSYDQNADQDQHGVPQRPTGRIQATHSVDKQCFLDLDAFELWLPDTTEQYITEHASPIAHESPQAGKSATRYDGVRDPNHVRFRKASVQSETASNDRINGDSTKVPSSRNVMPCLELNLKCTKLSVDVRMCRLLTRIVNILAGQDRSCVPSTAKPTISMSKAGDHGAFSLKMHFMDTMVNVLEQVQVHRHQESIDRPSDAAGEALDSSATRLAAIHISDLILNTSVPDKEGFKIDVGKLRVDLGEKEVLHFGEPQNLRMSNRKLSVSPEKTISFVSSVVKGVPDISITTSSAKLSLDLLILDQMIESIGGLSTLLHSSGVMNKVSDFSQHLQHHHFGPTQSTRTVRFEADARQHRMANNASRMRLNIRLGGSAVIVRTTEYLFRLDTSAIKLVGRDDLLGLQVDRTCLSGTAIASSLDESLEGLCLRMTNLSVKHLSTPEEQDLDRLIALLTPSKDKFEKDDDILVDTLISQRRGGSVLRLAVSEMQIDINDPKGLSRLQHMQNDLPSLASVSKYLPKESRPGTMVFCKIASCEIQAQSGALMSRIIARLAGVELAHMGCPTLLALGLQKLCVKLEDGTVLVGEVTPLQQGSDENGDALMLMARLIGEDLEPTLKLKLWNTAFEYSVPLLETLQKVAEGTSKHEMVNILAESITALPETIKRSFADSSPSTISTASNGHLKNVKLKLALRDCALGLTPRVMTARGLLLLSDVHFSGAALNEGDIDIELNLRKVSVLLIDDVEHLNDTSGLGPNAQTHLTGYHHILRLEQQGYVSVCTVLRATALIKRRRVAYKDDTLDVDIRNELFVLETCADSIQTLSALLTALTPPPPPSTGCKYQTDMIPLQDMLSSFTGDSFTMASHIQPEEFDQDEANFAMDGLDAEFDCLSELTGAESGELHDERKSKNDPIAESPLGHIQKIIDIRDDLGDGIDQADRYNSGLVPLPLPPTVQTFASKWDSTDNCYVPIREAELDRLSLRVKARDMHIIWNLYDGYDWQKTRNTISRAVAKIESKAEERRAGNHVRREDDEDKESVIGDYLFNSIYIGIPVDQDPRELTRQINRNLDDLASETGSQVSGMTLRPASAQKTLQRRPRKLKLERSRRHKIAFELRGVSADIFNFEPEEETQTSIDIRIHDFEIFDHVPTSTWKKFATYMHDAGTREDLKPMVHLEICNVKPVPTLTASELVIRATVLPVRLHVDQDALDFITRFFDFHDDDDSRLNNSTSTAEQPFLQRVEVRAVPIKLDYKPKKVDFAGLRSGRTKEFMNFFILDGANMVLKHTIIYGCSGFAKLHQSLEDVWMPDIKNNQLPSVLSGLNGVRTLVNVGTGLRDLVVIPVREYQKDGRIVRSISKGAFAFARTTGGELTRFGTKLAIGAQTALQGAEDYLSGTGGGSDARPRSRHGRPLNDAVEASSSDDEEERHRTISRYADQPTGILQGLKGAARSLERDLLTTRDVIVAISGEVREGAGAGEAARAVARHAPTLVLRPMIGVSRAVAQTLMGATNSVDPGNRRRVEDKYKRY